MGSNCDTDDDEPSADSFCIVFRPSPNPSKKPRPGTDQEGADARYLPTPTMVALSPDPPSSPMSGDTQSQPQQGTDQEGSADAVEKRSLDPPPRSESGASRRRQPTRRRRALRPTHKVESIFSDFKKRRGALIRALTRDEEALFQKCDPGMQPVHLYGGTDGSWEVKPPELDLPASEPEPTPGINKARDTMERHKWLQLVALHCDAWLIHVSNFAALNSYMTATERSQLFSMILGLPTVREIIARVEEKRSSGPDEANEVVEEQEVYLVGEQVSSGSIEVNEVLEEAEEDATSDNNFCASCNSRYNANAFWISCNACEKWYHGKCVNITSSQAEHMEEYECPDCYNEKVGHDYD